MEQHRLGAVVRPPPAAAPIAPLAPAAAGSVVLAGATGDLGGRIVGHLLDRGGPVRALVRAASPPEAVAALLRRSA